MRIVEVTPVLGPGGAERLVVDICNQFVLMSHEIYLIILYPIDYNQPIVGEIDNRVKVVSINKKNGFDIGSIIRLNKTIKRINPDVVQSHLYAFTYLFPSFIKKKNKVFLHTIHSDASGESDGGIKRWIRKYAFSRHKVYPVTISEESKASFTMFYGLDSKLIYNGRPAIVLDKETIEFAKKEIDTMRVSANSVVFVNVARVVGVKNQVTLAEAINSLSEKGVNVELIIIGDIKDKEMEKSIMSLGNERIHLLGTRNNPRPYMKIADAFVLSSKMEGMPITLIEAFSVGVIPVCTAVGGMKNMIQDGRNGILIETPEKEKIIEALMRFMDLSAIQKEKMALASQQSFDAYDIVKCAKNYELYMTELLKNDTNKR